MTSLRGKLLVATPPLVDDNFDRTVVLLLEHGDDGALGLVLNRPDDTEIPDVLSAWTPLLTPPAGLYVGGPVEPSAVIGLGRSGEAPNDHWAPVVLGLGTVDLSAAPYDVPSLDALRIFTGYAGWGAGQLEGELEAEAWIVCDAAPDDPFSASPTALWRTVLARQPGRLSWLANYPDDVSVN